MSAVILANALAMSEFQGYSGDCTQTAMLCCAHVLDPARFPLTAATLDALVAGNVKAGLASADGAQTLDEAHTNFTNAGIAVTQYGYSEPLAVDWHSIIAAAAGFTPVLMQVADGAQIEAGQTTLHYHAIAILGHDSTTLTYYCADGDNPACYGGKLVGYTIDQLTAAQPCGLLVVHTAPPPPPPPPPPAGPTLAEIKAQLEALAAQLASILASLAGVA